MSTQLIEGGSSVQWFYNAVGIFIFLGFGLAVWMALDEFVITPLMSLMGW